MKHLLFFVIATGFIAGCAPDPDLVCEQEEKIYANSATAPIYLEKRYKCVEAMDKRKAEWGVNGYRRYSECILASDSQFKAQKCLKDETWRSAKVAP